MLIFLVFEKIFFFLKSFAKLIWNFAKINNFIFAIFRKIQNNFVKISCFAKFFKMLFRSHPGHGARVRCQKNHFEKMAAQIIILWRPYRKLCIFLGFSVKVNSETKLASSQELRREEVLHYIYVHIWSVKKLEFFKTKKSFLCKTCKLFLSISLFKCMQMYIHQTHKERHYPIYAQQGQHVYDYFGSSYN